MKFYTKDAYSWIADEKGYRFCRVETATGTQDLMFYKGITKILQKGEQSLEQKLIAELGEEAGRAKAKAVYARGTKQHAKIENDINELPAATLEEIGKVVGQEVLVWSSNLKNNKVIGFIDAISRDEKGDYHLIDFKTKASPFVFNKYQPQDAIEKAYQQLVAYAVLTKQTYNIEIKSAKVVIVFLDGSEPIVYTLQRAAFTDYARFFLKKLSS